MCGRLLTPLSPCVCACVACCCRPRTGGAALLRAHYDRRHLGNPAAAAAELQRLFDVMRERRLSLSFEMVGAAVPVSGCTEGIVPTYTVTAVIRFRCSHHPASVLLPSCHPASA